MIGREGLTDRIRAGDSGEPFEDAEDQIQVLSLGLGGLGILFYQRPADNRWVLRR
jgi:hypothetical protein